MLSLEYLLEEAKNNGLPLLKKRAILREYLQVIILSSIYRQDSARSMYFTGGTAMRFFYNMPRFSEDLDFDTPDLSFNVFKKMLEYIKKDLIKEGFSVEVSLQDRHNLYVGEVYFKDLIMSYGITDKRGSDLMIKIEVYRPSWDLEAESDVMSLYGYNFSSLLLDKAGLFSEKLCALFNRKRGRDIYDTLFLLKRRFRINENVLIANDIKGSPKKLILEHLKNLSEKDLKYLANQVKPFLFKEGEIELVLKAPIYAEKFLREYE